MQNQFQLYLKRKAFTKLIQSEMSTGPLDKNWVYNIWEPSLPYCKKCLCEIPIEKVTHKKEPNKVIIDECKCKLSFIQKILKKRLEYIFLTKDGIKLLRREKKIINLCQNEQ